MMFNWKTSWQGMVLIDNLLIPNYWKLELEFIGISDNPEHEQIAFDRCKYIVEECYKDALWMNVSSEWSNKFSNKLLCHKITIPDEPLDANIAIATLSKFIAVSEGKLEFKKISIASKLGENVNCIFEMNDLEIFDWLNDNPIKSMTGDSAWFMRSDAGTTDIWIKGKKKQEIIKDLESWETHDLLWDQTISVELDSSSQSIKPIGIKGWKPKVIDGGKNKD